MKDKRWKIQMEIFTLLSLSRFNERSVTEPYFSQYVRKDSIGTLHKFPMNNLRLKEIMKILFQLEI